MLPTSINYDDIFSSFCQHYNYIYVYIYSFFINLYNQFALLKFTFISMILHMILLKVFGIYAFWGKTHLTSYCVFTFKCFLFM